MLVRQFFKGLLRSVDESGTGLMASRVALLTDT